MSPDLRREIVVNELAQAICDVVILAWEKNPTLTASEIQRAFLAVWRPLQVQEDEGQKIGEENNVH